MMYKALKQERQMHYHVFSGSQGSGKSYYAREYIKHLMALKRFEQVVIISLKNDLSDMCNFKTVIDLNNWTNAKNGYSVITSLLKTHKSIHIQLTHPKPLEPVDTICRAIMDRQNVLTVIDEAPSFAPMGKCPVWLSAIQRAGREQGNGLILILQSLKSNQGIELGLLKLSTHFTIFKASTLERERIRELCPFINDDAPLYFAHRATDGYPSEFLTYDALTNTGIKCLRNPENPNQLLEVKI